MDAVVVDAVDAVDAVVVDVVAAVDAVVDVVVETCVTLPPASPVPVVPAPSPAAGAL